MAPFLLLVPVVALAILGASLQYTRKRPVTDRVSLGFADTARNLGRGRGMTTNIIYPLSLWRHRRAAPAHPDTEHPPVFAVYLALMTAVRASDTMLRLASALPLVLVLVTLYAFGRRWFDCRTGAVAVLLCVCLGPIVSEACSGRPTMLSALWLTLALFLCAELSTAAQLGQDRARAPTDSESADHEQPIYGRRTAMFRLSLLLGAVTGLAVLTDYTLIVIVPITAAFVFAADRDVRVKNLSGYLVLLLALMVPWMVRNAAATGNPVYTLFAYRLPMNTSSYKAETLVCEFPEAGEPAWRALKVEPRALLEKAGGGAATILAAVSPATGLVGGFVVLGLVVGSADNKEERLRRTLMAAFGGLFLVGILFAPTARVVVPLTPIAVFLAARMILRLTDAFVRRLVSQARWALVGRDREDTLILPHLLVIGLCCGFSGMLLWPALRADARAPGPSQRVFDAVEQLRLAPDAVIATDAPWDIAWRTERRAVALPVDDQAFHRVNEIIQVDAIILTREMRRVRVGDRLHGWLDPAIIGKLPGKWVGFRLTSADFMFLREDLAPERMRRPPQPPEDAPSSE